MTAICELCDVAGETLVAHGAQRVHVSCTQCHAMLYVDIPLCVGHFVASRMPEFRKQILHALLALPLNERLHAGKTVCIPNGQQRITGIKEFN